MNITEKAKGIFNDVKSYWKTPPKGYYMNYKEILSYSVGGIGAYFIFTMATQLLLSTTNVVIGNTIGIQPTHMYIMYLISSFANIPFTAIRANIIDNVRHREGKYRPYILRMGIPTVIISMLFVFTPYSRIDYIWRCVLVIVYNFGLQFFYNFFYEAYENLIHVLSPNTQERANVASIKAVIYSLAPSITNAIIPLIAGKVSDGDIYDLAVYRWLYPFIAVFGIALCILVVANTKEKIVQAKSHVVSIRFIDALRAAAKNKYFWIISLAGWLGFLETAQGTILQWLYNYGKLCDEKTYSLITLIYGNSALWGMLFAPFFIKKWGKKKVLIVTNLFNVLFIALIYPSKESIWLVLICMWMNSLMGSFAHVLNPAIQADIRDYQQYKTGERIDGMFSAVALIGTFITMATSSVLPAVYEKFGIHANNGYENMYHILFDKDVLYPLIGALVVLSVVGAILNVIPYFFYDFTEDKQRKVIKILQIRAISDDYSAGMLENEEEALGTIRKARVMSKEKLYDLVALKQKIKGLTGEEKKAAKKEYNEAIEFNNEVSVSVAAVKELEKFDTPEMQGKLKIARAVVAEGLEGVVNCPDNVVEIARDLPKNTKEEKRYRSESIDVAKTRLRSKKATLKHYPDGLVPYDTSIFNDLYAQENALDRKQFDLNKELGEVKNTNKARAAELRAAIKESNDERYVINGKIKEATRQNTMYHVCAKAYLDAVKLIKQEENYRKF